MSRAVIQTKDASLHKGNYQIRSEQGCSRNDRPNPAVNGRGISELIDAGISVDKDILNVDAGRLNEIYTKFITSNIPFVILKSAASLDGKIALSSGNRDGLQERFRDATPISLDQQWMQSWQVLVL